MMQEMNQLEENTKQIQTEVARLQQEYNTLLAKGSINDNAYKKIIDKCDVVSKEISEFFFMPDQRPGIIQGLDILKDIFSKSYKEMFATLEAKYPVVEKYTPQTFGSGYSKTVGEMQRKNDVEPVDSKDQQNFIKACFVAGKIAYDIVASIKASAQAYLMEGAKAKVTINKSPEITAFFEEHNKGESEPKKSPRLK
jgi:hypothetical protein